MINPYIVQKSIEKVLTSFLNPITSDIWFHPEKNIRKYPCIRLDIIEWKVDPLSDHPQIAFLSSQISIIADARHQPEGSLCAQSLWNQMHKGTWSIERDDGLMDITFAVHPMSFPAVDQNQQYPIYSEFKFDAYIQYFEEGKHETTGE